MYDDKFLQDLAVLESVLHRITSARALCAVPERPVPDQEWDAPITPFALTEGIRALEDRGLRVAAVVFNPRDYSDIRMFGRDILDIETRYLFLRLGLMAVAWGSLLIADRYQPEREVMFLGEPIGEQGSLQVSANAIQVLKVHRPA